MTDPIAAIGARSALVEMPLNQPIQARVFSAPGASPLAGSELRHSVDMLQEASSRMFGSGVDGPNAMLANVERSATSAITPQDYLRSTLAATDLSIHVSMSMMKFHLSTSLGSAVTGLFNTLLKNRD